MIDPGKVQENLSEWLENPSWKAVYEQAPSEACKDYIAMMFYASETEEDEAFDELDALFGKLDIDDATYMFNNSSGGQQKAQFYQRINELKQ